MNIDSCVFPTIKIARCQIWFHSDRFLKANWPDVVINDKYKELIFQKYGKNQIRGAYDKFPDFFRMGIYNCFRLLKIHYVIAIHLIRWLTNFYDFRFKWTATAAIGIHPTKPWLSQLVNLKNAIWHFRRTICKKFCFKLGKNDATETYASDWFSTILHESSISFWVA